MGKFYYYSVWVRSAQYHGFEALTYASGAKLGVGAIVLVPLRKKNVVGVVVGTISRPAFSVKQVVTVYDLPPLPGSILALGNWMSQYYPAPLGSITGLLLPAALPKGTVSYESAATAEPLLKTEVLPSLTDEQLQALRIIDAPGTYLVHGRTGSGKTRIYIELAIQQFRQGKSVLLLVPEIGLTSQLAAVLQTIFESKLLLVHSRQTVKERRNIWIQALQGSGPKLIIGPRSALFSPVKNVGLIIVDEFHDQSYKQEQSPHYHAIRVASQLSKIHNAILILGSATPPVSEYYFASKKAKAIIRLSHLAKTNKSHNKVEIVSIKDLGQFNRTEYISQSLLDEVARAMSRHEQAMLFINRRGTARLACCDNCGWQARCPNCDITLTYHGDSFELRCHICGYRMQALTSCPVCGEPGVSFKSYGTKAVADEIKKFFPDARIARFDADNIASERFEKQYHMVASGDIDIIIGTQIIAKGFDLPKLSTLGVLSAESSLYLPDYTAQERTYQLLNQVIGRIGRGHTAGVAIIQSYNPESPLIHAAIKDNWTEFYDQEIKERQRYNYPPFCYLLKITVSRKTALGAERAARQIAKNIAAQFMNVIVEGPGPSFYEKANGYHRWQIILKSSQRGTLLRIIASLPKSNHLTADIDPTNLL